MDAQAKRGMGITGRAAGRGSAWRRDLGKVQVSPAGEAGTRVRTIHRPWEGFCPSEKGLSKAGMQGHRDHSGLLVSHTLESRRAGCGIRGGGSRQGRVLRTDGLAGPLSLDGTAPCFEKPVCLSELLTCLLGSGGNAHVCLHPSSDACTPAPGSYPRCSVHFPL